jgi:hypothetical protein
MKLSNFSQVFFFTYISFKTNALQLNSSLTAREYPPIEPVISLDISVVYCQQQQVELKVTVVANEKLIAETGKSSLARR